MKFLITVLAFLSFSAIAAQNSQVPCECLNSQERVTVKDIKENAAKVAKSKSSAK